jgi:lysosomal alpha-mannosidase
LKTFDGYYQDQVRYIFDTVSMNLINDKSKTFAISEIVFFERWWEEQNDWKKEKFREVVKEGRVEFVGGGWTMNDEACTYYEDIIDQIQLGHEFLRKEFNIQPKVAWQLDPFGKAFLYMKKKNNNRRVKGNYITLKP